MSIKFHLPSFTDHFRFNMVFLSMMENCKDFLRDDVEIASIFGVFPPSIWNGGRTQVGTCDPKFIETVIKTINGKGIPLRFTFTNPMLEEKHLEDKFCNNIMRLADNGLNEVIVVSPLLEEYIRKNYPKYKITSSTCKRLDSVDALNEELEKDYNLVVMDYDLNNRFELLEQIKHKDRCEILVNSCCQPKCKRRSQHYKDIGLQQIAYCEYLEKYPDGRFTKENLPEGIELFECPSMDSTLFQIKDYCTHITPDDIFNRYVPMGFNQFKIEGRTSGMFNLMETYMYYLVKPEYRDEARFLFMINLKENGIINCRG